MDDLGFHPYKLLITQELKNTDFAQRKSFAETMLQKIDNGEIDLNDLLMSDEAHFKLSDTVNKQNFCYWSECNPNAIEQKPLHSQRVTVWVGVAKWGIIGPYFFTNTVNGQGYIEMINSFLLPTLHRRHRLSHTWSQQDGATCHCSAKTLSVLQRAFGSRLLSRRTNFAWPPRSPDLTAPDFFYGGI